MACPGFVVSAPASGSGKTTVTLGLIAALAERGMCVQPFKAGPDFIDPGHHAAAAGGRPSRNLDGWLTSREYVLALAARATRDAEIAIVEGMMGLFDGLDGGSNRGSTAELAAWLGWPVVLVIDASAAARSVAALVRGFRTFDRAVEVCGVVFNRIGGRGHLDMLREACAGEGVRVIGGLPFDPALEMRERHLGLETALESAGHIDYRAIGRRVAEVLDLGVLLELARPLQPPPHPGGAFPSLQLAAGGVNGVGSARQDRAPDTAPDERGHAALAPRCRIGVARDAAFCFYYEDNLEFLRAAGAEIVAWSPLASGLLPPDIDGVYLGGGYPELHASALASGGVGVALAQFAAAGGMIYAECGGFMVLQRAIRLLDGSEHAMAQIFPGVAVMHARLQAIGYVEVAARIDGQSLRARGHEFRHSTLEGSGEGTRRDGDPIERVYHAASGGTRAPDGFGWRRVLASYVHLHFASAPDLVSVLVARAAEYRRERRAIEIGTR